MYTFQHKRFAGFLFGMMAFVIVQGVGLFLLLQLNRADVAGPLVWLYQALSGKELPIVSVPFTDIGGLPQVVQDNIARLWGAKITAGIDPIEHKLFGLDLRLDLYQIFQFLANLARALTR